MKPEIIKENQSQMRGFLGWVERVGNKVPHPVYLFIWLFFITLVLTSVCSMLGLQAINPTNKEVVAVVNMLTGPQLGLFLKNIVNEFATFRPLGMVVVATIGLGVANRSGLLETSLRLTGMAKSATVTTALVFLVGICGNIAGDAAFIILPPLTALLFQGMGRNPLAGLFAGFAGVACGFGANLLIGSADAALAGLTEAAAQIIDPSYVATPAMGYYYLFASTIFLVPIGTIVTMKYVEPKLNKFGIGVESIKKFTADDIKVTLSQEEKGALKAAALSVLAFVAVIVLMTLPGLPFAAPEGKSIIEGYLLKSVPPLILLLFFIPGYVYGKKIGKIKSFQDTIPMMCEELKTLASFILICFFASMFISVFSDSNIGFIIAIKGAEFLQHIGLQGPLLLVSFVIVVGIINLFIGSASAKYALLSTVFVPMLMMSGIDPAATQAVYRMGDSITNNITPTLPYLAIVLSYAQEYDNRAKTGTVMAYMLPYTIAFGVAWCAFLAIWYLLGLPMGPGYSILY